VSTAAVKTTRESRIYLVRAAEGGSDMLVRAKTKAGAVALVAASHFSAELCSQDDLLRLAGAGTKVIDATETDE